MSLLEHIICLHPFVHPILDFFKFFFNSICIELIFVLSAFFCQVATTAVLLSVNPVRTEQSQFIGSHQRDLNRIWFSGFFLTIVTTPKSMKKTQRSKSHVNRHCNCVSKLSPLEQAKIARIGIKLSTLSALQEQCCPFCFYQ